ncbi:MAG: hypothetical protein RL226_1600, partial [Bacteroidota bacterium]
EIATRKNQTTEAMNVKLAFVVALVLFAGCKNRKNTAEAEPVAPIDETMEVITEQPQEEPVERMVLYYERTSCFGTCPSFTFAVSSSGAATYEGRNFVNRIGKYTGQIEYTQIYRIIRTSERYGYDTLQTSYDNPMVMDLPSVITEINGKRVENRYRGPDLEALYSEFDTLIEQVNWQGETDKK